MIAEEWRSFLTAALTALVALGGIIAGAWRLRAARIDRVENRHAKDAREIHGEIADVREKHVRRDDLMAATDRIERALEASDARVDARLTEINALLVAHDDRTRRLAEMVAAMAARLDAGGDAD